jgi:hypothetical protein
LFKESKPNLHGICSKTETEVLNTSPATCSGECHAPWTWRPCSPRVPTVTTRVRADASCPALPRARNGGAELVLTPACAHCPRSHSCPLPLSVMDEQAQLQWRHCRAGRAPWQLRSLLPRTSSALANRVTTFVSLRRNQHTCPRPSPATGIAGAPRRRRCC